MQSDKIRQLLKEVEEYLEGLSEQEKAQIAELRFTAKKKSPVAGMAPICFDLVHAVPFVDEQDSDKEEALSRSNLEIRKAG